MKTLEILIGWAMLAGLVAFAVGFDGPVLIVIALFALAIIGAWHIGHRLADRRDTAEQRADDDGFCQRREPEELGQWPFIDKGQDNE